MKKILVLLFIPFQLFAQNFSKHEIDRWEKQAKEITIIRDNWGIPHIYGKTDADAVFGLLYAQCEDDFRRVEMNYIEKLGRTAEIKGEAAIYEDLLIRMMIDTADAKKDFEKAPAWLKKLMIAYADGINYYLYKNPAVKPALLTRFQPWYPLLWTDGSIGAISTGGVSVNELKNFYSGKDEALAVVPVTEESPVGSNGFAFSPKITASGNAILYINPHVTFYFRPEVHMVSEEGLNAYGAVTWGQLFVYQGFNENCGWMHTSSSADISDAYIEKLSNKNGQWTYEYEGKQKPVTRKKIEIKYKTNNGFATKSFHALFTHHGPIMAKRNGQYISVKHNNRDMNGLIQSWERTKANSFAEFKKTMDYLANPSNNTVYADSEGNIAYWHGNFLPVRDPKLDWSEPVDGTTSATEWKGLHKVEESVHIINPENGWIQNCNSTPFTAAGRHSPKAENYPRYMAPDGENYRGINAVRVLDKEKNYTLEKVITKGYDTYMPAFENLIPALVKAFENNVKPSDTLFNVINSAVNELKNWDLYAAENSIATTLAVEWGQRLLPLINKAADPKPFADFVDKTNCFAANAPAGTLLSTFYETVLKLNKTYGTWRTAWGDINRFQRISNDLEQKFDDDAPSFPVAFTSSQWGMLPSYRSTTFPGTTKRYGTHGNSFVAAVEFGKTVKAKSLLAGGQSGDPNSPHFFDQGYMYSKGKFKDVLFYKDDVLRNAKKTYKPGQ